MKTDITIGEKYGPCAKITNSEDASKYFEELIEHTMSFGHSRMEAIKIEKQNIAYFAGYFDHETRIRIEELFKCRHPILGKAVDYRPTAEECLELGKKLANKEIRSEL
jgi:hypothetical protein